MAAAPALDFSKFGNKTKETCQFNRRKTPTLKQIMGDELLFTCFQRFLDENLMSEPLLFFNEVEKYKKLSDEERPSGFARVYNVYICDDRQVEMVFPENKKEMIDKVMAAGGPYNANIFDDVQLDQWIQLNTECVPRFITSQIYYDYIEGKVDSPRTAYRRWKLEEIFGEEIKGQLTKAELVDLVNRISFGNAVNKRKVKLNTIFKGASPKPIGVTPFVPKPRPPNVMIAEAANTL